VIAVVMGVSGSGKSIVGRRVAERLGWVFADGDDFHPQSNVDKMHAGHALTDDDRAPWLHAIREAINGWLARGTDVVLACSALKRSYRSALRTDGVRFIYLEVDRATLEERLAARKDHFMPASLLDTQLATLEVPTPDEAVAVDGSRPLQDVVDRAVAALRSPS
jgi:gluconokinase